MGRRSSLPFFMMASIDKDADAQAGWASPPELFSPCGAEARFSRENVNFDL